MARTYQKGTVHTVIDRDKAGNPTNHIEQDTDGDFWHVQKDEDPVQLRDAEHVTEIVEAGSSSGGGRKRGGSKRAENGGDEDEE